MSKRVPILTGSVKPLYSSSSYNRAALKTGIQSCYISKNYSTVNPALRQSPSKGLENRGPRYLRQHTQYMSHVHANTPYNMIQRRSSSSDIAPGANEPIIHDVFEKATGTWQYVVADPSTLSAVIIDPVLDYDPLTQSLTTNSADSLLWLVSQKGYRIEMLLETHIHADHITAASYLQNRLAQEQGYKPPIGIGKRIGQVQQMFAQRYGIPENEYADVFDVHLDDDEVFKIGQLTATAIHLPGHTPDHLGYKIGDNVFCGDSLFHVDIGTARCDFPGGSANNLYTSGRKLLSLSDDVKIWTGHDYPPDGRKEPMSWATVQNHKGNNGHLKNEITEGDFVAMRTERDAKLAAPRFLHQSLQMNIRAGRLPMETDSGHRMLHLPLKLNGVMW